MLGEPLGLSAGGPAQPRPRPQRASKLEPFHAAIGELLEQDPHASAIVILQRLRQRGFDGGVTILKDYLHQVRTESASRRAYVRVESPPAAGAMAQPRAVQLHVPKHRPNGDVVMPPAVAHFAAVRAASEPKQASLTYSWTMHSWTFFRISLPSARVRPRVSMATSSRSSWATSCTCSWPVSLTATSWRRSFMPYLPYARPADKRLLGWWIEVVSCHQGTKCSSGLAPPPQFLVVSYIQTNADLIPNFGERRNGERISTATAESTVNQVISKRMVKKQQMRWSRRGAHLLLQVRTRELNGELRHTFAGWYPALDREAEQRKEAA